MSFRLNENQLTVVCTIETQRGPWQRLQVSAEQPFSLEERFEIFHHYELRPRRGLSD